MRSKNSKAFTKAESAHLRAVKLCATPDCNRPAVARGLCHTHYMRLRRSGQMAASAPESDQDYISARVTHLGNGCWEWQLSRREGYGRLVRHGKTWQAHAFSYCVHVAPIPSNAQVNHLCHNRSCVNPDHLYAGTQAENVSDMLKAGRGNPLRGARNGNSKVSLEVVCAIRQSNDIARVEAKKHGISLSLVYAIRKGLVWREVDGAR